MPNQEGGVTPSRQSIKFPGPSWMRLCRWLWRVLLFVWGTLVVNILVGTIANLNTTTTDKPLSKLFIVHLALTFPTPVFSSLGILILLTLLCWIGSRERDTTIPRPLSEQDRTHMLRRLRLRYEQMLSQSLQGVVKMELGLASKPAAVQNAASFSLHLPDQPEQLLPPSTSIVQAYELAQQELLILGEPGAGKSTLLLELAYYLVQQAEQDTSQPLPILLPLSSWAASRRPLSDWLCEQVTFFYDVPLRLSQQWVQAELVLPLLDGLDEIEQTARADCIAAINIYHRDHLRPLVVCSRTDEYDTAAILGRLVLHTAVVVQPLSEEQVITHLTAMGKPLTALRTAIRKNLVLQALTRTPLMLQIFILAYHGTSVRELPHKEAQLRQQIWMDYVQRMVSRKGDVKLYQLYQTTEWLGWLARQMRTHNQTIFFLERLQPDWLPERQRAFYKWIFGLATGLGIWLGVGLFYGTGSGLVYGMSAGLVVGVGAGLRARLNEKIEPVEVLTWSWSRRDLRSGLVSGLVFALFIGMSVGMSAGLVVGMSAGLLSGLVVGLGVGLFSGVSWKQLAERRMLTPNEGIRRSVKNGLGAGLGFILVGGLGAALSTNPVSGLVIDLILGLFFGLSFGLYAAVQHYTLRFLLRKSFPWKAVPFLNNATDRVLLRRVGGGYGFTHRLLMDYFADLDLTASSGSTNAQPTKASQPKKAF